MSEVGTRISLTIGNTIYFGTILYEGLVLPTKGIWLGVEWDDSSRGKHDGIYETTGVRYFNCRILGSGSFIRPQTNGLSRGVSFSDAIKSKYLGEGEGEEEGLPSSKEEGSTFFETSSNFRVEVVSLAKIKERFKQLLRLREIGLEREGVNGVGINHKEITDQLSRLETLSLSFSLIYSFEAVDEIVQSLPTLRNLELNSNRFRITNEFKLLSGLANLTSLHLNKTLITWSEILSLSSSFSSLEDLQLGFNHITTLNHSPSANFPRLHILNLDSNLLTNFSEVISAVVHFPSLTTLILSSNKFTSIPKPSNSKMDVESTKMKYLNLSDNLLGDWSDLDNLALILPNLEGLWVGLNPVLKGEEYERIMVLARIASLISYEGSPTRSAEREDAELFYLSTISKEESTKEEKILKHPRYEELLKKYEVPPTPTNFVPKIHNLKSKLIDLRISQNILSTSPQQFTISVLPTIPTRLLRTQIAKMLNINSLPAIEFGLVALLQPSEEDEDEEEGEGEEEEVEKLKVEIPVREEGRQVNWWGLKNGDGVELVRR